MVGGSNQLLLPSATPIEVEAYVGVYTTSSLVEQVTPTAFEISDSSAIVSNITFQITTSTLMTRRYSYPGVHLLGGIAYGFRKCG